MEPGTHAAASAGATAHRLATHTERIVPTGHPDERHADQPGASQLRVMTIICETTTRPLSVLLAGLVCGHALGQDLGNHESVPLRGMVSRMVAEQRAPQELRLYGDAHPDLRFGWRSAPPGRAPRIGLEFAAAPDSVLGLDRGTLLRAKLSETSQLSLHAHRRGLSVLLRTEF